MPGTGKQYSKVIEKEGIKVFRRWLAFILQLAFPMLHISHDP